MLHVPGRARGGYPLQAPDVASRKQWISVLLEVIESVSETPSVMACLPQSYDADMDTLRRPSSISDVTENQAAGSINKRASWYSSMSGSSGSFSGSVASSQEVSAPQEREKSV